MRVRTRARTNSHANSESQCSRTISLSGLPSGSGFVCVFGVYLCVTGGGGGGAETQPLVDTSCYPQCLILFTNDRFDDPEEPKLLSAFSVFHPLNHLSACNTKKASPECLIPAFQMPSWLLHDVLDVPHLWSSQSTLTAYYEQYQALM